MNLVYMKKKSLFAFLKILFIVLIILIILFNPKMTGNVIFNLEEFNFNFSNIILFISLFGLVFVLSLEKHLNEEEYAVEKDEYRGIKYRLCRAENDKGRVVLIAPGMGLNQLDSNKAIRALAEQLARKGISSISFEIQKGDEAPSPRRVVTGYLSMARLAKEQGYNQIHGIYGSSLSAGPALVAAGRLNVKKIALRAPLVYFHELFDEAVKTKGGKLENALKSWRKKGRIPKGESTIPYGLYKQFADADVNKVARRLKDARVEITHGTRDETVPIKYAEKAYEKLREAGANVRLDRIEGAGHEFNDNQQRYAIKRLRKSLT